MGLRGEGGDHALETLLHGMLSSGSGDGLLGRWAVVERNAVATRDGRVDA